jgi:hypothetical protein
MREFLFLSHANPEDKEFTLWLALQLAGEGYPVWCDLTNLLGGEEVWSDIEKAIRQRTLKFIYVVSKTSNTKRGPLKELTVAENVARDSGLEEFIIPVLIDDLPPRDINIQLSLINAISFTGGWAKGLKVLLEKLEKVGFPKDPRFNPAAVASWWRAQFSAEDTVLERPEDYLSNWYPVENLPPNVYFHILFDRLSVKAEVKCELPYPAFQHKNFLVTFAKAEDFEDRLGGSVMIADTHRFQTQDLIEGKLRKELLGRKESRDFIMRLLRLGWEMMLKRRKLPVHEMANDTRCFYFTKGLAEQDTVHFRSGSRTSYRQVVGYRTVTSLTTKEQRKQYWHFGVQAKPLVYPRVAYYIKPHVVFSDDGTNLWEGKKRMHAARRRQCKSWWNAEWRDRILASMTWLTGEGEGIELPLGSDVSVSISNRPLVFTSPVSYIEPEKKQPIFAGEDDGGEEDFDEEDFEDGEDGE